MEVFNTYYFAALTLFLITLGSAKPPAPEDIGTNFFLKASKSVPRIGRRTVDYENYFLKASKSIPRIGRRTLNLENENDSSTMPKIYQELIKKNFFEKYFKGNEEPGWNDLEKLYRDYPGTYQPEDSYPESGTVPPQEPYWKRIKKDGQSTSEEQQTQTK